MTHGGQDHTAILQYKGMPYKGGARLTVRSFCLWNAAAVPKSFAFPFSFLNQQKSEYILSLFFLFVCGCGFGDL